MVRASPRNIRTNSSSPEMSGRIDFSTTSFLKPASPFWYARKISDMPPAERRHSTSYFPIVRRSRLDRGLKNGVAVIRQEPV